MRSRAIKGEDTAMATDKVLHTIPEVMAYLRVSRWMVYELIHKRELATITNGRCRRVPVDALDDYIARRREEAA